MKDFINVGKIDSTDSINSNFTEMIFNLEEIFESFNNSR